jgi:SecD/SecF fusion protein
LGIILDKRLISAPEIRETISDRGTISGGSMTDREVDHIVQILNAGSLPAALNKEPISEWTISPTLGATTVEAGKRAILWSLAAVIVFMIVYYRFAGVIACLALAFNLLLVLALMVLIKAAFTLPGLAGLVLTIGMSVDANVLIYERIREELRSGAALRMAIRNGFSRAMSAIIDSNVTTIIAGVALYYIGTDQVKGFAVTLILGILTSMFTAIFFSRLVFDICERQGWIKEVRMMKVFSAPNFDFLGVRWPAIIASLILIAIGMFAVYKRGGQMLDIDFTGGSSVTFALNESDKMPIAEVRDVLEDSELADKNLLIV